MSKILIVEDNRMIVEIISLLLQMEGYQTRAVIDPAELPFQVQTYQPDLIILDVMLGSTDGREICRQLKNSTQTMHIPIIMCSATDEFYQRKDFGADDYILKPFDIDVMASKVKKQLTSNHNHHQQ